MSALPTTRLTILTPFAESVVVIAPHGIQLETHRGFPPSLVLSASRRFIPMSALQDFVINEGLRRWDARYYLAAIRKNGPNGFALQIAYEVGSCVSGYLNR